MNRCISAVRGSWVVMGVTTGLVCLGCNKGKETVSPLDNTEDIDVDTNASCINGHTRCHDNMVERCMDETWWEWDNCDLFGKKCVKRDGEAKCVSDSGTRGDIDAGTDVDTNQEIAVDADTGSAVETDTATDTDPGGDSDAGTNSDTDTDIDTGTDADTHQPS
jgi:hypothetical protein